MKYIYPGHLTWCLMLTPAIFILIFFGTSFPVSIVISAFAQCSSFSSRLLERPICVAECVDVTSVWSVDAD